MLQGKALLDSCCNIQQEDFSSKKAEKKEDHIHIFPEIDREIPALALSKSGIRVEAVLPLSHRSSPFLAFSVPGKYIICTAVCQVMSESGKYGADFSLIVRRRKLFVYGRKTFGVLVRNLKKELAFLEWCDKMIEEYLYCAVINCRCTERKIIYIRKQNNTGIEGANYEQKNTYRSGGPFI